MDRAEVRRRLDSVRTSSAERGDAEQKYRQRTYRYLRIGVFSMLIALLVSILIQSIDAGGFLGSLSAYYYTPVQAMFIATLVLVGVVMIVIRGDNAVENVALNIAGLTAPIVGFVPTSFPSGDTGYENLFAPDALPLSAMRANNLGSLAIAAALSLVLIAWIHRQVTGRGPRDTLRDDATLIGFMLAAVALLIVAVAWWADDSVLAHKVAAAITIIGLVVVAILTSVRNIPDGNGDPTWRHHLKVGLLGGFFFLGATLFAVGAFRLVFDTRWIVLAVGAALIAVTLLYPGGLAAVRTFLNPRAPGRTAADRRYLAVALTMIAGGPFLGLVPGDFGHRTLIVELVELIPFGAFWVLQTIEYWDEATIIDLSSEETPAGATDQPAAPS